MKDFMLYFVTAILIFSSVVPFILFVFLWIERDFDYAWNRFEQLVDEVIS